jgi:hypothetical protein
MNLNLTDPRLIVGAVVILLIIIIGIALYVRNRRKTAGLRQRFGSEYDRAVLEHGSEHKAEAKLADRETRVESLKIRELGATERERFLADWNAVQSRFVDHPKGSVTEADELVASLMQARGYPVADFEQRAARISPSTIPAWWSPTALHTRSRYGWAGTKQPRKTCGTR